MSCFCLDSFCFFRFDVIKFTCVLHRLMCFMIWVCLKIGFFFNEFVLNKGADCFLPSFKFVDFACLVHFDRVNLTFFIFAVCYNEFT